MNFQNALSHSMTLCSKSERCVFDIKQKHSEWGVSEIDSDRIIKMLIEERFIDESRFAGFFVRDKFKFNGWGKIKLAFILKSKQLSNVIINESLNTIDNELYLELLVKLLTDKKRTIKASSDYELKSKLIRFAQSRGFEYEIAQLAIQRLTF